MSHQEQLSDSEFLRYQRQLALPEIGEEGQIKLQNAKVLVVGCGGLGSTATQFLAGAGVGLLVLADGDVVEVSNLHRQTAYREGDIGNPKSVALANQLNGLNQSIRVRTVDAYLDQQRLKLEVMMADLVLDCSDNFPTRQQINRACFESKTPLISGSAIGWRGQLVSFNYRNKSAGCYRCFCSTEEKQPENSCQSGSIFGPVAGVIGTLQASEAIKMITQADSLEDSSLFLFDAKALTLKSVRLEHEPLCPVCSPLQSREFSTFVKSNIDQQGGSHEPVGER